MKTEYAAAEPYVTKDGSVIRELLHPSLHAVRNMSLAEAIVEGGTTPAREERELSNGAYVNVAVVTTPGCLHLSFITTMTNASMSGVAGTPRTAGTAR